MLERFRQAKAAEVARLLELQAAGRLPGPRPGPRPGLTTAIHAARRLGHCPVIAEHKRASPSRGVIRSGGSVAEVCAAYAAAGACALSVLTEERFFGGHLDHLEAAAGTGLPVLRKDFVLHPVQVRATAATAAAALLLIVRLLDDATLAACLELAQDLGLEAVVEVFDAADLARATAAGARLIQANARDLDTLKVDLERSLRLVEAKQPGQTWIAASGIGSQADLQRLLAAGFDAALVGTALMAAPHPGHALRQLLGGPPC